MTFRRTASFGAGEEGDLSPATRPESIFADPPASLRASSLTPAEPPSSDLHGIEREGKPGPTAPDKCANVIAKGSRWTGSLVIDDSVRIEGQLNGDLEAKGTVHIAEGAVVEAKIRAAFVVISGAFKGEVVCQERLELLPRSRVQGELVTKVLNVHEGAIVDGNLHMSGDREQPRPRGRSEPETPAAAPLPVGNGARPARPAAEPSQ